MSENDIRMDADKWECELMEDQLKRLQDERDEAIALSEGKNKTINTLTRMYWQMKHSCTAALETVKRQRVKKTGKLWAALGITVAAALLAWVGMETQVLSALVGKPVEVICLAVGSFLSGWIFQSESNNLKLYQEVSKQRAKLERKGE